ncbi:MAG: type II toxin-antitoxin system RelE/ParE family toxin [Candidatus Limnocylindrales bacterium]
MREFLRSLSDEDAAEVVAAMTEVRQLGLQAARKLRNEIWEVRADGNRVIHRILFAQEGRRGFVLLALVGFTKKTQRTPPDVILLAEQRLADWRSRGQ